MNDDVLGDYKALDTAKWFAITSRGSIAMRFGPFDGPTIGKIMTQCQDEGIPILITADCGPEFDWEIARDMRGYPEGEDPTASSEEKKP